MLYQGNIYQKYHSFLIWPIFQYVDKCDTTYEQECSTRYEQVKTWSHFLGPFFLFWFSCGESSIIINWKKCNFGGPGYPCFLFFIYYIFLKDFHTESDDYLKLICVYYLLQECETKYEQQCSTTYEEVCEEALPQYTSYGAPTGYGAPKQCKQVRHSHRISLIVE